MCRIGAIKSKVPVEPAKALYLMLPQQEGHDNSGYAMVMQDLYGVFEGHKDKPLLSLACTPRGVRMVDAYMAEQGFEQVLEWLPDVDRRPGLDIKAMPCYVFRNYEYPEAYRGRTQAERRGTPARYAACPAPDAGKGRAGVRLFLLARRADLEGNRRSS